MKSNRHAPRMFGALVVFAALAACAQPRVQQPTANDSASPAVGSADQVANLQRYAARMEELYAAQEAEILNLRRYSARMEEIYAAQESEILSLRQEIARRVPSQ